MNLAVNKKAIINALWKGTGRETPFSYYYYPFHKGYSTDWKIPPYDPERAKKLLAEAGHAGGFEVRVNPMVHGLWPWTARTSWRRWRSTGRRSGSRSSACPEATAASGPRAARGRRTRRSRCTARRPSTSRWSAWERVFHSKGAFNLLARRRLRRGDRRDHAGVRPRQAREADARRSARSSTTATTASCSA